MEKIGNIFRAHSDSIKDTFLLVSGSAGFRVPLYQRAYAWRDENITRLFEDMVQGLRLLQSSDGTVTFLGTIILVEEAKRTEPSFDGSSFSIVDGQQRLTTLCLTACVLATRMDQLTKEFGDDWPSTDFGEWLKKETELVFGELQACIVNRPGGFDTPQPYQLIPRIVREETDRRGRTAIDADYKSPVAFYISCLARHFLEGSRREFKFSPMGLGEGGVEFFERLKLIEQEIAEFESGRAFEANELPAANLLLQDKAFRVPLFPKSRALGDSYRQVAQDCKECDDHKALQLIRLISVSNYLIHRVAVTRVEADTEEYAFDIFDALNTTGEPLTAIETFKPLVIRREQSDTEGGYLRSDAYKLFSDIEAEIDNLPTNDARQRESKQVITLLALYAQGRKISESLNTQRSYLRRAYEQDANGANGRRRLVRAFHDIVEYRRRFWSRDQLPNELSELGAKRNEVLFSLDFIRDLGNTLTIPILARYLNEGEKKNDLTIFSDAVMALTSFLALRRGATGTTQGIDDDYRNLMRKGSLGQGTWTPLLLGLDQDENDLPDIEELRSYLRNYLAQTKIGIKNREEWISKFSQQPHFKTGKSSLCRFYLLTAAHNSIENKSKPYLMRKIDRRDPSLDHRTLSAWRDPNYASTEHVAPQSRGNEWSGEAYNDIYSDVNAIHTVGNLTLLPREENSASGNSSWQKRKLFYGACLTQTREQTQRYFREAERKGIDFGPGTKTMIEQGNCLSLLKGVAAVDKWTAEIIRERAENIGALVWHELAPFLGL